jgi:hypothetical protein
VKRVGPGAAKDAEPGDQGTCCQARPISPSTTNTCADERPAAPSYVKLGREWVRISPALAARIARMGRERRP